MLFNLILYFKNFVKVEINPMYQFGNLLTFTINMVEFILDNFYQNNHE